MAPGRFPKISGTKHFQVYSTLTLNYKEVVYKFYRPLLL